ncbi:hypothetical protein FACS1894196_3590 [Clostridia bacterium]|nr:hypothetical protein FACS1894196_3590 [Clostridia bacterium]
MRRIIWTFLLLSLLLGVAAGALAEDNLLQNGGFEVSADGWPTGWTENAWRYDEGVSYLELHEGGQDGGQCALVENVASNDARFLQTVAVEPDTVYRLSGWVRAEGCDPDKGGANLSVMGAYYKFPAVYDTQGEWVYLESYVRTHAKQNTMDVGARLGIKSPFSSTTSICRVESLLR